MIHLLQRQTHSHVRYPSRHSFPYAQIAAAQLQRRRWAALFRRGGSKLSHDILLQATVEPVGESDEGQLIRTIAIPWLEIAREIELDPEFLYQFANEHRKFEEFLAATYHRWGFPSVTRTPASGDLGRDVIAEIPGYGAVRFYDQAKAFSPGNAVTANDVRAAALTRFRDQNVSKVVVTTTSVFAPGVYDEFKKMMPYDIELKDGDRLREWLKLIAAGNTFGAARIPDQ